MTDKVFDPGNNAAHHQIEREYFLSLGAKQFSGDGADVRARLDAHEVEFFTSRGFSHYRSRWGQTVPVTAAGLQRLDVEGKWKERKGMATEYGDAGEVRRIAEKLINEAHPHLRGARIEYVFLRKTDKDGVPQPPESKGEPVYATPKKVSGLNAHLAREKGADEGEPETFFALVVSHYHWQFIKDEDTRRAMIDHYLCYFALNAETDKPELREPDVREFAEIVKRRGLWNGKLRRLVEIGAEQLKLPIAANGKAAKKSAGKAKGKSASAAPAG